jgi:hypothetical protein
VLVAVQGYDAVFVFAIALFKIFADQIKKKSFEGLLRFLKFDPDEVTLSSTTSSTSALSSEHGSRPVVSLSLSL